MNCPEYEQLTPKEKVLLVGKITHCLQSDATLLKSCEELIRIGEIKGIFEGVTILPDGQN